MKYPHFIFLLPGLAAAATPEPASNVMSKTGLDLTVLRSRVKLTNEYSDYDFGVSQNTTKLNLGYAFGSEGLRDWNVQLDLPFVDYNAGDQASPPDATGLGDIEMRILHVFDGGGFFRWGLGAEAQFNTASEQQLGDGIFRLSPAAAIALQATRSLKFQTTMQFDQSLRTEAGVPEQRSIKLKPAVQFDLPGRCYGYVETNLAWNLQEGGEFGSNVKVELGHTFGVSKEWVASVRCETPLIESSEHYALTGGISYTF